MPNYFIHKSCKTFSVHRVFAVSASSRITLPVCAQPSAHCTGFHDINSFARTSECKVVRSFIFNKIFVSYTSKSIRVDVWIEKWSHSLMQTFHRTICVHLTLTWMRVFRVVLSQYHTQRQVEFCRMHRIPINLSLM